MKSKQPKTRNPVANFLKTQAVRHRVEESKKVYKRRKITVKELLDKQ